MKRKQRFPDLWYGGEHLGAKEAQRAIQQGCPPTEIFLSFLAGKSISVLSKTAITQTVQDLIRRHTLLCYWCRNLTDLLLKKTSRGH